MPSHLLIKTSSLGDVVHMLPAISDAAQTLPDVVFDWVVEEGFAEVPVWHPQVRNVIPVAIRRWRKSLLKREVRQQISAFKTTLQAKTYDKVIDSQGLVKSALISRFARGTRYGYNRHSIREPLAALCYQHKMAVSFKEHAITRNRLLLGEALGYEPDLQHLDYGIADNAVFRDALHGLFADNDVSERNELGLPDKYLVALHGTSRKDKEWPLTAWQHFIPAMGESGYAVLLPWGNEAEHSRANTLARQYENAQVLPRCSLTQLAGLIANAAAVIGMDTGLMHVAAAFEKKGIALYPVTQPELTGVLSAGNSIASIGGRAALDFEAVTARMLGLLDQ